MLLWNRYAREREDMALLNGEDHVNERLLFHGTGRTPPEVIYEGVVGFDLRCTAEGNFYGRGRSFCFFAGMEVQGCAWMLVCSFLSTSNTPLYVWIVG